MLTRTISALAAVGLTFVTLVLATPLRAAPVGERTVKVEYGDLDLSTARGAATPERRVRSAAERICGPIPVVDLPRRSLALRAR